MLEIGCATGKATLPLARRGFQITCIELGPDLAVAARRNLDGLGVNIIEGRFEDWQPTRGEHFKPLAPIARRRRAIRSPPAAN